MLFTLCVRSFEPYLCLNSLFLTAEPSRTTHSVHTIMHQKSFSSRSGTAGCHQAERCGVEGGGVIRGNTQEALCSSGPHHTHHWVLSKLTTWLLHTCVGLELASLAQSPHRCSVSPTHLRRFHRPRVVAQAGRVSREVLERPQRCVDATCEAVAFSYQRKLCVTQQHSHDVCAFVDSPDQTGPS